MTSRDLLAAAGAALLDDRRQLSGPELEGLAQLPAEAVPALASLAHEVRLSWCGPEVEVEGILSAKTGGCPEDCHFCSQSARFESPVKATPFLDPDEIVAAAQETARLGASEFCLVLAIRGTAGALAGGTDAVQERNQLPVLVSYMVAMVTASAMLFEPVWRA